MATEKRAFLLQQWSEIIQARVASGKCIRHWCNEHGVRENQYYYWLRELQKEHYDESVQGLHANATAVVSAGTYVQLYGELQTLTRDNDRRKALLFEKENEEIPKDPKYKVSSYYDYGIIKGFEHKLIEILEASKFRGASSARLDMGTFDIEIDGHPKAATSGGGYCGILNCITTMAMGAYLIGLNRPAPGFFAVDSSLTQLSQGEHIALSDSIKQNFVRYLIDHASDRQVIFVEQKERMPFIPDESENVRVIEFTENRSSGRYGFLNDLYNPEV